MRSRGNVPWTILLRTTRRTAASFIFAPRRTRPETAHVHSEGGNLGARCHGLRRQDAPTGEPAGGYWTILLLAGQSKSDKAATDNPTNQPRPFHCPDCYQVIMPRAKAENWKESKTLAEARQAGHVSPCSFCFG